MSNKDTVIVSWRISKGQKPAWSPEITIGYKHDKPHDHVSIPLADLSKVISEMKVEMRVAKLEAKLKTLEDNPIRLLK